MSYSRKTEGGQIRTPRRSRVNPRPGGVGAIFWPPSSLFAISLKLLRRSSRSFQHPLVHSSLLLHIVSKNCSRAHDRLATNDVRMKSCSAIFDAKKGFEGRALMPTVLKIEKNNQYPRHAK